ncbi:MAG TPA: hypothetical protein VLA09_07980, partial [Longimicrobiales bacterium]|nr:hypothetical protein [Longimicrobiales bacterium]
MRSAASEGPDRRARAHARRAALSLLGLTLAACTDLPTDIDETSAGGCSVAGEIAVGQTRSGQLDHGDCPEGGGIVGDRWRLSLATDTTVRIDLTSDAFDAYLELRDASGVILASNDDWGSLDSRIVRTLAAGSYTIVARSLGPGGSGPYRLSVLDGASCVSLGGLEIGETVAGILEAGDCSSEWNAPAESWTLDLRQSRRLRIDLESADLDEVLLLRDPQGYEYWSSDWSHPVGHARIEAELPAGRWTVTATAAYEGARGSYELTVALPPACTPGTDFVLGETVSGALTPDDCTFDGWTPAD